MGTVQRGVACDGPEDCENGYCLTDKNVCEFATGPACSTNLDCGTGGTCVSSVCTWSSAAIDVKPAFTRANMQGKRYARVQAVLHSNAAQTRAPTITSWGLRYTCAAQE